MRKKIVAGNWKMNKSLQEGIDLAIEINKLVAEKADKNVDIIIAPPFIHLSEVGKVIDRERILLSAQNCAAEQEGAFTGEVSAEMLWSVGADYVIIGHSERRAYYHEDNDILNKKIKLALDNNLKVIFCCGENLEQRESNQHFKVIKKQLTETIFTLEKEYYDSIIIAYEPIWAIGTGKTASPEQAQEIHKFIRSLISEKYGDNIAKETSILYGGSCKPSNAKEIFAKPDVDGGLIGGAALKAEDFIDIVNSFK
ncbi:MAG: triose-phosphate isomerase [Bacteroidetes bacterium]|nr:MAG: triose-phosphate isomerase [Bacteroidota bacterium]